MPYHNSLWSFLSSSSSPLGPKSWTNRCWVPWATWWSITSTAFTQPSHQRDPSNTDPPWMLFPTQTSMPASFSVFIFSNSFLPYDLPKGLRTITVFLTSNDYVKKNEWAQEVIGKVVFFLPSPSLRWFSADLDQSEMWPPYSSTWFLHLFSRQQQAHCWYFSSNTQYALPR